MLNTCAAPPESLPLDLLDDAKPQPSDLGMMQSVLNAIPSAVIILDSDRQIFFANRAATRLAGKLGHTDVQGMRVGEMVACRNLDSDGSGCGTARGCRTCGELQASATALRGEEVTTEQLITTKSGDCYELQLTASPFVWQGDEYALLVLTDISAEKRREMLERVLFHDVLSMATGVSGLLAEAAREPSLYSVIKDDLAISSQALVTEIKGQQQLIDAELGKLVVLPEPVVADHLLREVREAFQFHPDAMGKEIALEADLPSFMLRSDPSLLKHILGNLLRNAPGGDPSRDDCPTRRRACRNRLRVLVLERRRHSGRDPAADLPAELQHEGKRPRDRDLQPAAVRGGLPRWPGRLHVEQGGGDAVLPLVADGVGAVGYHSVARATLA